MKQSIKARFQVTALAFAFGVVMVQAQTVPNVYWVDVGTRHMAGMEEMDAAMSGGGMGGMFGGMMSKAAGVDMSALSGKELHLRVNGRNQPNPTEAQHAIPPTMLMGQSLTLRGERKPGKTDSEWGFEKPQVRMLIYWGCGDSVRQGQPLVLDTQRMSLEEFGRAMPRRTGGERRLPNEKAHWPNAVDTNQLRRESSLIGQHQLTGAGLPDNIRFALNERQDFMQQMKLSVQSTNLQSALPVQWPSVPEAKAYFLMAMAARQNGELVIWTSSEVADTGSASQAYLPPATIDRWLSERVLMPTSKTNCTVPAGIFANDQGAMLMGTALGGEVNFVHPPKPADPKVAWNPEWAVKVRYGSFSTAPLGVDMSGGRSAQRAVNQRNDAPQAQQQQQPSNPLEAVVNPINALKGLFGR